MGKRRMVNTDIIDRPDFMALNTATQVDYIRLVIHGDDEGFVCNPKLAGVRKKSIKELENAGLIFCFDTGTVLVCHWYQHNTIRKDSFKPTAFKAERALVTLDEEKIYRRISVTESVHSCNESVPQYNTRQPNTTQNKTSKDNPAAVTAAASCAPPLAEKKKEDDFSLFWAQYPKKVGQQEARSVFLGLGADTQLIMEGLEYHKKCHQWVSDDGTYVPDPANWLKKRGWEDRPPLHKPKKEVTPRGATGQLGPEELAAIQQALAEG